MKSKRMRYNRRQLVHLLNGRHTSIPEAEIEMHSEVIKVTAGALIPSLAAIVFNILHYILDNNGKDPPPHMQETVWDISVACAFTIIGIAVSQKDPQDVIKLFVVFALLVLFIISVTMIIPHPSFLLLSKFHA